MNHTLWENFISKLSTKELEDQLSDILTFTQWYQQMITNELEMRKSPSREGSTVNATSFASIVDEYQNDGLTNDIDFDDDITDDSTIIAHCSSIDFFVATRIQQSIEGYNEEELYNRINDLNNALYGKMSDEERVVLQYEIEQCKEQLDSLKIATEDLLKARNKKCYGCGSNIGLDSIFCPECGVKIGG